MCLVECAVQNLGQLLSEAMVRMALIQQTRVMLGGGRWVREPDGDRCRGRGPTRFRHCRCHSQLACGSLSGLQAPRKAKGAKLQIGIFSGLRAITFGACNLVLYPPMQRPTK
jgi:hypothetical protein